MVNMCDIRPNPLSNQQVNGASDETSPPQNFLFVCIYTWNPNDPCFGWKRALFWWVDLPK